MMAGALGIIAGGGELPPAIADAALAASRPVFILALRGSADAGIESFPHEWIAMGELGRGLRLLKEHGCSDVLLAGRVARPKFSEIKLDTKAVLAAPRVFAAARKGDDALLRSIVDIFAGEGLHVVGVTEAAPSLLAPRGIFGKHGLSTDQMKDIALAIMVVRSLGSLDIGQAAVVCDGLVLAVEAAEGTDQMIARVATLPENIRGVPGRLKGVLLKAPKPTQDGKTDLPVIGIQTVKNAVAAGLAGIGVEAGKALVINREGVVAEADRAGLFLYGFAQDEFPN